MSLSNAVGGLPPTRPPVPLALFVYVLAHDDEATAGVAGPRTLPHKQLGAWYGGRRYEGIILSFFKSILDARESLKSRASLNGGERIRNVVATWDLRRAVASKTGAQSECAQHSLRLPDGPELRVDTARRIGRHPRRVSRHSRVRGEGTPVGYRSRRAAKGAKAETADAAHRCTR